MITALQMQDLDIAIGLTEGFVRALASKCDDPKFQLVGTYVESPLCWAISTGARRDIHDVQDLKGKRVGVSRIGR
jgi:ABC-type nitrate/sulfonate/bicarbonate transport system substrate-binding protein